MPWIDRSREQRVGPACFRASLILLAAFVIATALPGCGSGSCGGDGPGTEGFFVSAQRWLRVSSMNEGSYPDGTVHVVMQVAPVDASHVEGATEQETIAVHSSFLPGIRDGLSARGDVFLAMASRGLDEEQVAYVIVRGTDGRHHLAGECTGSIERAMQTSLGDRYDATMDQIIGTSGRTRIERLLSSAQSS